MPKKKKTTKIKKQPEQPQVNPTQPTQVNLTANNQFCSVLHATFFEPQQCDAIVKACVEELWMSGETIGGGVNKKIRNVDAKSVKIETEEDELLQEEETSNRKKSDKKGKKIRLVE